MTVTRTRCTKFVPNDWVAYVDATTGWLLHVDLFFNAQLPPGVRRREEPPGGWNQLESDELT